MARTRRRTGKISLVARAEILVADDARDRIRPSPRDPGDPSCPRYVSLADVSREIALGVPSRAARHEWPSYKMAEDRLEKIPRRVIRSHPSCSGCRSLSRAIASRPAIAMRTTLRFFFVPANGRSLFRYYCSWRTGWSFFFLFFSTTSFSLGKNSLARHLLSSLAFYFFLFPFFSREYDVSRFLSSAESTSPTNLQNFCNFVFCYISPPDIFTNQR